MRASLSLHHAFYRHQRAQITKAVEGTSSAFRAYESRYRRRTRSFETVVSLKHVFEQVARSDIAYVGDYHTLRAAQQMFGRLVESTLRLGRRLVIALEFIEGRHQRQLEAFLQRRMSEAAFLAEIGHTSSNPFSLWFGFRPLLELARKHGLEVVGIDRRAHGPHSLARRDQYAAEQISARARAADRPLVLALAGQFHIAAPHLPKRVAQALGDTHRRQVIVYQNCDGIYWRLLEAGKLTGAQAVHLRDNEFCILSTSPVICQQSFLDYLESESGDESAVEQSRAERFRELARWIARFVAVDISDSLSHADEGGYGERSVLEGDQAAEGAALFVRHACISVEPSVKRSDEDAFYARCVELALGYFGSKLINPQREVPATQIGGSIARIPKSGPRFDVSSRALGYRLGEALYQALDRNRITAHQIRKLFRDPLIDPRAIYRELALRTKRVSSSQSSSVHKTEAHPLV